MNISDVIEQNISKTEQFGDYLSRLEKLQDKVGEERMKKIRFLINTMDWADRAYCTIVNPHKTSVQKIVESGSWAFQFRNCIVCFVSTNMPTDSFDKACEKIDKIVSYIDKNFGIKITPEIDRGNGITESKRTADIASDMERYISVLEEFRRKQQQKGNNK